ncbi:MAG: molybdenum cofactor biosysynthesis protein [Caldilinea sp. CFX5]|nr:molybdenum cofactor biosysynthesis protein [Caldilinea sp. CFX5]
MLYTYPITIHHLYISPGHNYFGHKGETPGLHPTHDVATVEVKAGAGLVGDRFFGRGADFDGHVTFFAWEVYQWLLTELGLPIATPAAFRRNVLLEGAPLNQLIGQTFAIDGVQFRGTKHCAPCRWMDLGVAPGALAALKGRGGLRAQALSDGWLHKGAATLTTPRPLDLTTITEPLARPKLP